MSFTIADNLPEHIRRRLEALKADKTENPDGSVEPEENTSDAFDTETSDDDATVHIEQDVEPETAEHETDSKTENDIAAWKGRLKKEQEEKERYRIAAENGSFAAAKLLEMQEREKQREAELEQLRKEREQWQQQQAQKQAESDDVFSEDELNALRLEMGDEAADILAAKLRRLNAPSNASSDVEALRRELRERQEQEHSYLWTAAVTQQIPELQGMLQTDSAFVSFLSDKKDFKGNSAMDMVAEVGASRDVSQIPAIRALIDEYQNSKSGTKEKRVASPKASGGIPSVSAKGKKKATQNEWNLRQRNKLVMSPEEFRAFLEKYDWS